MVINQGKTRTHVPFHGVIFRVYSYPYNKRNHKHHFIMQAISMKHIHFPQSLLGTKATRTIVLVYFDPSM